MNTVRLDGMRFVNESGNQVLFHGINVLARDCPLPAKIDRKKVKKTE